VIIHADLHFGNVKWVDGRLGVFDFDDAGWGVPALDLAISAYYLRDLPGKEAALRSGYASVRPLPECSGAEFESLVAARNFTLLNTVVSSVTSGFDEFAAGYVKTSTRRFQQYLRTGRFELDVESHDEL
jgi:Ser/Thr protein kinase RdoA (MazF antagonist)